MKPNFERRVAEPPQESAAHPLPVREATFLGNGIHEETALFDQHARSFDTKVLDGFRWRLAGLRSKRSAELLSDWLLSLGKRGPEHRQTLHDSALVASSCRTSQRSASMPSAPGRYRRRSNFWAFQFPKSRSRAYCRRTTISLLAFVLKPASFTRWIISSSSG
jgi:hypothetical protein